MGHLSHPSERASKGNTTSTHFVSILPNTSGSSVNMLWAQLHFPHWNKVNSIKYPKISWLALHVSSKLKIETKFSNGDFFFWRWKTNCKWTTLSKHPSWDAIYCLNISWIPSSVKENLALGTLGGGVEEGASRLTLIFCNSIVEDKHIELDTRTSLWMTGSPGISKMTSLR